MRNTAPSAGNSRVLVSNADVTLGILKTTFLAFHALVFSVGEEDACAGDVSEFIVTTSY